jgi:putative flippase GtrA
VPNKIRIQRLRRWLRFVVGGGVNTLFTYGIYLGLNKIIDYQVAYLFAYVMGILFSYWFNSVLVFRVPLSLKAFFSYPLVYVMQYVCSAVLLGILVEMVKFSEIFAPLVVTVGMLPLTYVMSKLLLSCSSKTTVSSETDGR